MYKRQPQSWSRVADDRAVRLYFTVGTPDCYGVTAAVHETARVICELDNPMRDPGDGTIISATNISIVTYAGDGKWRQQEDIYNPLRFVKATVKWCRKAEELGTLPDVAAEWMAKFAPGSRGSK